MHPKRRLPARRPNHAAVALWVEAGAERILLGADLEEEGNQHTGWSAVLQMVKPGISGAMVSKVAHHGSENGDHERIWSDLLAPQPFAILSPFQRGGVSLPTIGDLERISGRTENGYITAHPQRPRPGNRSKVVERCIRETTKSIRQAENRPGHVRLRKKLDAGSEWNVELFGPATHIRAIAASGGSA